MASNRRRMGAGLLVAACLIALIIPFLSVPKTQPATTPPPTPPGGDNHGGNGGMTTSCTMNCPPSTDNQAPQTTIKITGKIEWQRGIIQFYYPNFTVTLQAVDDESLSSIILNDTGHVSAFHVQGRTSTAAITITLNGLHMLSYHSTDEAGNIETPHQIVVGLSKPDLADLQNLITNSGLDNAGIKNALTVKVQTAQDQLAKNHSPNALNALSNQLNALVGKHVLDQAQADLMQMIISTIKV